MNNNFNLIRLLKMYVLLRLKIAYENFIIIVVLVEWICLKQKQWRTLSLCHKESDTN